MKFYIISLFPEIIINALNYSVVGRAIDKKIIELVLVDIRKYSKDPHKKVDDYGYGGGGMILTPQPILDAFYSIKDKIAANTKIVFLSPQGKTFDQKIAFEYSNYDDLVLICGNYEGIDQRIIDTIITEELSIGDYVLTGGEISAVVVINAISRLIPGVLNRQESYEDESFSQYLLEYPQYTRPYEYNGLKVPDVLLSGNHQKIRNWRKEQAINNTRVKKPKLYKEYLNNL